MLEIKKAPLLAALLCVLFWVGVIRTVHAQQAPAPAQQSATTPPGTTPFNPGAAPAPKADDSQDLLTPEEKNAILMAQREMLGLMNKMGEIQREYDRAAAARTAAAQKMNAAMVKAQDRLGGKFSVDPDTLRVHPAPPPEPAAPPCVGGAPPPPCTPAADAPKK